jgi:hypothetical protein
MKIVRELRALGDELGLKCLGLEDKSKHYKLMFQRADGQTYGVTLHKSKNEPPLYKLTSTRKNLERFAAGREMFGQ